MTDNVEGKGVVGVKPEVLLMDLGEVILYSKEDLPGKMNPKHKQLVKEQGVEYPFFDYFSVREGVLSLLEDLKDKYRIYMITEGVIQNNLLLKKELERVFDYKNIISTGALGLSKQSPEAYKRVVVRLRIKPEKILFVDDSTENIKAAESVGLQTIQFESEVQVIAEMKQKLRLE